MSEKNKTFNLEKVSGCKVKLTIAVTKEDFEKALDPAFEKVSKDVSVKGFRKGKVPKDVYLKMFGESALYQEAINITIQEAYFKAVEENNILVVSDPVIDLVTPLENNSFTFSAEVEVYPEVVLGQYKELEVERLSTLVTEEEIENEIKKVLGSNAVLKLAENSPIEKGDTAVFDFEGFVDGVAFEGGQANNYSLEIGSGQFIPGFEDQMIGMKANEEKDVNVVFPENYQAENLKGKAATFKVKVHEVKKKEYPELNDEFVKTLEIDNVNTVEEYKESIKKELKAEKEKNAENDLVNKLMAKACENAKVDIPNAFIEQEKDTMFAELEAQAKQYGLTAEKMLQFYQMTIDQYKEKITEGAKKSILEKIVLQAIVDEEKLDVSKEELEKEYSSLSEHYKKDVKTLKQEIKENNVKHYIKMRKAINLIKDSAK
ncbi:MAG: trigger factor [Bacilli bacterium]|jgi:trigger factor